MEAGPITMSDLITVYRLVCDKCGVMEDCLEAPMAYAVKEFNEAGWAHKGGVRLCKECQTD